MTSSIWPETSHFSFQTITSWLQGLALCQKPLFKLHPTFKRFNSLPDISYDLQRVIILKTALHMSWRRAELWNTISRNTTFFPIEKCLLSRGFSLPQTGAPSLLSLVLWSSYVLWIWAGISRCNSIGDHFFPFFHPHSQRRVREILNL